MRDRERRRAKQSNRSTEFAYAEPRALMAQRNNIAVLATGEKRATLPGLAGARLGVCAARTT